MLKKRTLISNQELAKAYCKFLHLHDWNDKVLVKGMQEGRNKFLSNAFIECSEVESRYKPAKRYLLGHFYSAAARDNILCGKFSGLAFEHMVPKDKYIQKPCEELAKRQSLQESAVCNLLDSYWKIAIITQEENKKLPARAMPKNWDGQNILARYEAIGISLIPAELIFAENP